MKKNILLICLILGQSVGVYAQEKTDLSIETDYRKQVAGADVNQSQRIFVGKDNNPLLIDHCYHYLPEQGEKKFLTSKYNHAEQNQGKMFDPPAPPDRAVQGQGVYCAKTPVSTIYYGDRKISG